MAKVNNNRRNIKTDNFQRNVPRKRTVKPKSRKRKSAHRAPTVITFAFLLIYLLGYLIAFANKPSIGIEPVNYGTVDTPKAMNGVIVRDEYVVKSTMAGNPVFYYSEKDKVKKGALVCSVKNIANTDIIEEQIEKVDKSILEAQKSRSDISVFQEDITAIENKISGILDSYTYKFVNGNISDVYSLKSQVEAQINRRNEIWILENNQSLSELSVEKTQYEAQLSSNISSIKTDFSGIVSYTIDGFEEALTLESLDKITKEQTSMKVEPKVISKTSNINVDDPVFKIIKSNVWYIAAYISEEITSSWEEGDTKILSIEGVSEEKNVQAVIEKITPTDKMPYVVFKTDKNMDDFIDLRTITFTVKEDSYKGLKIPNNAIVEKTLLKIPVSCIIDNVGEAGVIRKDVDKDNFVKIKSTRIDADDGDPNTIEYAYVLQDFDNIRLGDTILSGSGENATTYEIKDVLTYKGVFVVNSSIAEFRIIDIVGQNAEYSIVKPSDGSFGLKIYDNIVSDAKNIKEGDTVF